MPSSLAHLDIEIESEGSVGKLLCANIATSPGAMEEEEESDDDEIGGMQEDFNAMLKEVLGGNINLAAFDDDEFDDEEFDEEIDEEELDEEEEEIYEMLGGKNNLAISDCGDEATHGHVSSISQRL